MPDWSYITLFRPLLFQLPSSLARDFTLHAMRTLSKLPGGRLLIRTMGHMESYPILETNRWDIDFPYPVGLSGTLDIHGTAPLALAQLGFGFMEIGPVTVEPIYNNQPIERDVENEAIIYPDIHMNDGVDLICQRLQQAANYPLPVMLRTRHLTGRTPEEALEEQRLLGSFFLVKSAINIP